MRSAKAAPRGFTLIELMVASAIAFIIVAAAASLASAMARNVKRVEEQSDLAVRAAITHSFLADVLSGIAYNWVVSRSTGSNTNSGSFGQGACDDGTGLCSSPDEIMPIRICKGSTVDWTTCEAPDTGSADALITYVPRDSLLDAVTIQSQATGDGSTTAASWDGSCATNPAANYVVQGKHAAWAAGDIVLVSNSNHVNVGRLYNAMAASTSATANQAMKLDMAEMKNDDGGRTTTCDPSTSLSGAEVIRVKWIILKLESGNLVMKSKQNVNTTTDDVTLISNVADLGFRIQVAQVGSATGSLCTVDETTNIWSDANLGGTCGNVKLVAGTATTFVRPTGLHVGVLLKGTVDTQTFGTSFYGVFDRNGTVVSTSSKKLHRSVYVYQGLSNASAF